MGHVHQPDNESGILPPGTAIAQYDIVGHLGGGGMGDVYLARDRSLGRQVALKLLRLAYCQEPEFRKRFMREAQTLARLDHPNIIKIYEVSEFGDRPFIAMQYVDGHTLGNYVRSRSLDTASLLRLMIATCSGLESAHSQGIIHRDLKPGNIMVDTSQRVYLLDFGLAGIRQIASSASEEETISHLTRTGYPIGTIAYMAPEQLRGLATDHRVDIFALGVTLYELATGEHPFTGATSAERASGILRDEPQVEALRSADLPSDFVRIVRRCLRKDPAKRYHAVSDIRIDLEDLLETFTANAATSADTASTHGAGATRVDVGPVEREFVLSAELVRSLSFRAPQMIGDRMTFLDNGHLSDTLVVALHGMGLDQRSLSDVISHLPCRAIAPTLYGFGPDLRHRFPLSLKDQSVLLRALMREAVSKVRASKVYLVGVSSGSDHFLHMLSDDPTLGDQIAGLLLLGVNVNIETCHNSKIFSELKGETGTEVLESLRLAGQDLRNLGDWLLVSSYQVQVLEKFKTDLAPLSRYASDIVAPFTARGHQQFVDWYRMAVERVRYVRFVFFKEEWEPLDEILRLHLDTEVLGKHFDEASIVRKEIPHMQLLHAATVAQCIEEFLATTTSG